MSARVQKDSPDPLQPHIDELAEFARKLPFGELAPWQYVDRLDIAEEMIVENDGALIDDLIRMALDPKGSDGDIAAGFRKLVFMPIRRLAQRAKEREEEILEEDEWREADERLMKRYFHPCRMPI